MIDPNGRRSSKLNKILVNIHTALIEIDMFRHGSCLPQNNEIKYCISIKMMKCNVRIYNNNKSFIELKIQS